MPETSGDIENDKMTSHSKNGVKNDMPVEAVPKETVKEGVLSGHGADKKAASPIGIKGKKPGPKKVSMKQKKFVRGYIESSGNATTAVIRAGYNVGTRKNAGNMGWALLKKPKVQEELRIQLQKAGMTDEYAFDALKEVIEGGKGRKATAADALKGIDMFIKLRGLYPAEKRAISTFDVKAELRGKTLDELEEELDKLRGEREELLGEVVDGEIEEEGSQEG